MEIFKVTLGTNLICSVFCLFFTRVVEIEQGKLRGVRTLSRVNKYYGIQYATSERFQAPKEPRKWKGVYDAINPITMCPQSFGLVLSTNEDCLYLDVFSPEHARPGDKLPVYVFIHGGAYYQFGKTLFDPEFLVTKNIVAVTINYRLGVLGFLCVNGVANLGLKDQAAALIWVKKNIAAFGGDPNHVTLAGQSAGSASTSLQMLSEKSAGLFHKVILTSGFAFSPWAFNVEPLRPALIDANKISNAQTEEEIYNIFATTPIKELLLATQGIVYDTRYFKYSPCVDSHLPDPFFRDTPYDIIKSGHFNKVPVLMGVTDREGIMFYGSNNWSTFADWNANFVERLPSVFSWCSKGDRNRIAHKMRSHYFGRKPITERAVQGTIRYYSDWLAHATFDGYAELLAQYSGEPVYKFVFSYVGDRNFLKLGGGAAASLKGASHSDDLFYVFNPAGVPLLLSNEDKQFIDRYTTMLANFIKYSSPIPHPTSLLPAQWPATTSNQSYIMHLDRKLKLTRGPWQRDDFFLNQLCKYGLRGYVPCESAKQCYPDDKFRSIYTND